MGRGFRGALLLLLAAVIAATGALADPPPWAGKGPNQGGRNDQNRGAFERAYGRPTLTGTVTGVPRPGSVLDVRGAGVAYRVDISRADINGIRRARDIGRGARVLIWGSLVADRTLDAARIQVLDVRDHDRHDARYDPVYGYYSDRLDGRVTRRSSQFTHRDISVSAGGFEWRIEVPKDARVTEGGRSLSVHDIRTGDYVRIEGERLSSSRFRAARIEVQTDRSLERWPETRRDEEIDTYTGAVRSRDSRAGTFELRLNFFETYTVRTDRSTAIWRGHRNASLSDLHDGTRVIVRGRLDGRANAIDARVVEIQ